MNNPPLIVTSQTKSTATTTPLNNVATNANNSTKSPSNTNISSNHSNSKGSNWTMLEDFYLLEGMMKWGKKWNKVIEFMEASGHLNNSRTETAVKTRWANLSKVSKLLKLINTDLIYRAKILTQGDTNTIPIQSR
jgi:hypothetical protein